MSMEIAVFSTRQYDRNALQAALTGSGHRARFITDALSLESVPLAADCAAVCIFVNDRADAAVLERLSAMGVRLLALRCAGTDHVDLGAARRLGIAVTRVGDYSPHSVAEHAALLLLALVRHLPQAVSRTRDFNFALDGLVGFDLRGKTVGILGTGRIGAVFAGILRGLGCHVLGHDIVSNADFLRHDGEEVSLPELQSRCDVISLHCALNAQTRHLIDATFLSRCRPGLLLINTSRGAVVDSAAALAALESGQLGGLAMDVYEREAGLFFDDHHDDPYKDPVLAALLAKPNVIVTGHQGFLTEQALQQISASVVESLDAFATGAVLRHAVPD
jgi:D-lactate dehydrogenase